MPIKKQVLKKDPWDFTQEILKICCTNWRWRNLENVFYYLFFFIFITETGEDEPTFNPSHFNTSVPLLQRFPLETTQTEFIKNDQSKHVLYKANCRWSWACFRSSHSDTEKPSLQHLTPTSVKHLRSFSEVMHCCAFFLVLSERNHGNILYFVHKSGVQTVRRVLKITKQ